MKFAFDFAVNGPINIVLQHILSKTESSVEDAELVITESVDKVLHYLQQTPKKVVQVAFGHHHPMVHLVEDYPDRLRVVSLEKEPRGLLAIVSALDQLNK